MHALAIIVVGLIMLIGIGWTGFLVGEKDQKYIDEGMPPARLWVPIGLGMIVFIGVFIWGFICLFDEKKTDFTFGTFILWNAKALVFAVALTLKSYVGPLVVSFCLSVEVYFLIEYGQLRAIPLIGTLADWLFEFGPEWLSGL